MSEKEVAAVNIAVCSNGFLISIIYKINPGLAPIPQDNLVAKDTDEATQIVKNALLTGLNKRLEIV